MALVLLSCLGQYPFYGEIPENIPTYKMTFPDGSIAYGALLYDGQWRTEDTAPLPASKIPTIVYDTPWAPQKDRPLHQPECVVETLSLRKKRLAEDWRKSGYAPVQTSRGEYYAPTGEIALAKRASDMENAAVQPASSEATAAAVSAPPVLTPRKQGPIERWGAHAGILAIGLTITIAIFRRMVLAA